MENINKVYVCACEFFYKNVITAGLSSTAGSINACS